MGSEAPEEGAAAIETVELGRSGVQVTRMGLGGAPLGGLPGLGLDCAPELMRAAWDGGIRAFDTAPFYGAGLSELRMGGFLSAVPRSAFTLTTKVGRLLVDDSGPARKVPAAPGKGHPIFDFSADAVRASLEHSCERLGLDRVDVALIHDPDDHWTEALAGAYPALEDLRASGVVRAIGAGMNQAEMLERFVRETDIDCVLVAGRCSLLDDRAMRSLLPACIERGKGVIVGGVFNSGILAAPVPQATFNYEQASPELLQRAKKLQEITERHGVALPAAAIHYTLRQRGVCAVVVGAASPEEVSANLAHLRTAIPEELWTELESSGLLGWRDGTT